MAVVAGSGIMADKLSGGNAAFIAVQLSAAIVATVILKWLLEDEPEQIGIPDTVEILQ